MREGRIQARQLLRRFAVASALLLVADPPAAAAGDDDERQNYLIVFSDVVDAQRETAAVEAAGGRVVYAYAHALRGVAASLPDRAVNALRSRAGVAWIELDGPAMATAVQPGPPWGLDRVDQRALPLDGSYRYDVDGSFAGGTQRVTAYVIDTGILSAHVEFAGRVAAGYTAIKDRWKTEDCSGHGTHVAGTIGGTAYGVAKQVRLVPVRVLGCNGVGTWSGVVAGIDWAASHHPSGVPAVANLSLGGGANATVDRAVAGLIADGVVVSVAAGNDGVDACGTSPARVAAAVTVAATTSADARATFSNYGACVDVFAPGVSIVSAWHTSTSATAVLSGTSMAAPHATGAAALIWSEDPQRSAGDVAARLLARSTAGAVSGAGTGSPNRLLYSLAS